MSLALPLAVVIGGAAALAGLLYLLQRLRLQRRIVVTAAAMLWRQAAREAPLSVRGPRFRYWLAYLLALAIALILWLAAAHPAFDRAGDRGMRLFYLDLSAGLTGRGEAAAAKRALLADVRATPAERRTVYLGDVAGTKLLAVGESASLLAQRLDALAATARPSGFGAWLRATAAGLPAGQSATVRYYGAWPVARQAAAGLPSSVHLDFGYLARGVAGNRGIVALGVEPAASGRWSRADVLVEATGAGATPIGADAVQWTVDGRGIDAAQVEDSGRDAFVLRDVPAAGGLLRVALRSGDGFAADDAAELRLPDRRPVRVAILAGVPATVRAAISADDAFVVSEPARAQVTVRMAGTPGGSQGPALVLAPASSRPFAFLFAGPGERAGGDLSERLDELGLAQIDAAALADELHRPIAVDVRAADRRTITVWRELFDPRSGFVKSSTMPLFVSQGLRWLAGTDPWIPYARAGDPLPDQSRLYGLAGRGPAAGSLADVTIPDDAGALRIGGRSIAASLTDRATTRAMADAATPPAIVPLGGYGPPDLLFVALLLAAGLLLALEWWLFQRGRMP